MITLLFYMLHNFSFLYYNFNRKPFFKKLLEPFKLERPCGAVLRRARVILRNRTTKTTVAVNNRNFKLACRLVEISREIFFKIMSTREIMLKVKSLEIFWVIRFFRRLTGERSFQCYSTIHSIFRIALKYAGDFRF
jgi:hypothetical protein